MRDAPQFYLTAPSPCPYLPGMQERKVFTHLVGRRAVGLERRADPDRLPSLADDRLPAGLRELPRLRLGPGAGRRLPPQRQPAAGAARQRRHRRRRRAQQAVGRAIRAVPPLPRLAPSRRRHGRHVDARLFDDDRGQPHRHVADRIPPAAVRRDGWSARASPTGSPTACRSSIPSTRPTKPSARSARS